MYNHITWKKRKRIYLGGGGFQLNIMRYKRLSLIRDLLKRTIYPCLVGLSENVSTIQLSYLDSLTKQTMKNYLNASSLRYLINDTEDILIKMYGCLCLNKRFE